MWRKQDEPKPSSASSELVVAHIPPSPRESPAPEPEPALASAALTEGLVIKGEIFGDEDILVDGDVRGGIRVPNGVVSVGPHGRVKADVQAREIIVHGLVCGSLRAKERVHLGSTGRVRGDIVAPRLVIEDGAQYRGKIDMVPAEAVSAPRSMAVAASGKSLQVVSSSTGLENE